MAIQSWKPAELPQTGNSSEALAGAITQLADAVANLALLMSQTKSDLDMFRLTFDQRLKQLEGSLVKDKKPRSPK